MNKQTKTYLLIVAVVAVWGTIVYRLIDHFTYESPELDIQSNIKFKASNVTSEEELVYKEVKRDPFTGRMLVKKKAKKKKIAPKEPVVFPAIAYNGMIGGETKLYVISINGNQELFKIKETKSEIRLISATSEKVVLRYKNVNKTFSRIE